MSKRIKKALIPVISSRSEAELAVSLVMSRELHRRKLQTQMDGALARINENYAALFKDIDAAVDPQVAALQNWAAANPAEFKDAKSIRFATGTIGFRTGMPALKLLSKMSWEKVLAKLQLLNLKAYIRLTPEVNKEALIDNRNMISPERYAEFGVKVTQAKTFYVEPAVTEPEKQIKQPISMGATREAA